MKTIRGTLGTAVAASIGLLAVSGCGGSGGSSTGDILPGLVLVNFEQSGEDNVPLNRILKFTFSAELDPDTVGPNSIQIREGPTFGGQVFGKYVIAGNVVRFEPRLPGLCGNTDSGLHANKDYRVSFIGSPEEFAIRSLKGDPLLGTVSATFHTRIDTDPLLFEDASPSSPPFVAATTPADEAHPSNSVPLAPDDPIRVQQGNTVVIDFSENISPCTISQTTVLFFQYATGVNTTTYPAGFFPESDPTPSDPYTWGGTNPATTPPRRVRSTFVLQQDFLTTRLVITPNFGEFPDNALLVVELTNGIKDFGGNALIPHRFSFVTENRPANELVIDKVLEFDGDVPILAGSSTAEVNTARSLSKVQGFLLFSGDSDNGATPAATTLSSGPDSSRGPLGCTTSTVQANDGAFDVYDPTTAASVLSTGTTRNTCLNSVDGSTAVVFEFSSFHIGAGKTVRITGVNPAIILVAGTVRIDNGGILRVRGDNLIPNYRSDGVNGVFNSSTGPSAPSAGGSGFGGGGDGGQSYFSATATPGFSTNGTAGHGSPDQFLAPGTGGNEDPIQGPVYGGPLRKGAGRGAGSNGNYASGSYYPKSRYSPSGGGGGHAQPTSWQTQSYNNNPPPPGTITNGGSAYGTDTSATFLDYPNDPDGHGGRGGQPYGNLSGKMPAPEAGSGGGGGGYGRYWSSGPNYAATGGGGGAGGGFVDLTAAKDISIFGTIDAAGGAGGRGADGFYNASGGGGGGSGGGIRLLTPGNIAFSGSTVITALGGAGGMGGTNTNATYSTNPSYMNPVGLLGNDGGRGGIGRLVLEDGTSTFVFPTGSNVHPGPTDLTPDSICYYGGPFDASRFLGGGLRPVAVTDIVDMGPAFPKYSKQVLATDFIAGIPAVASRGGGLTSIYIEVQGYTANPDGTVNAASASGWKNVGYFTDSGSELSPDWHPNARPPPADIPASDLPQGSTTNYFWDVALAPDSVLVGRPFLQFRFSFYLKANIGPFDPGPYIDRWTIQVNYNQ
jgi:hypothetical protein